jgi:hypothetical protein
VVDRAEQVERVISLMAEGNSERSSCEQVGINRGTFRSAALRLGAADQYAQALELLANDQAEKVEQCIDDMRAGTIDSQMARVEIDARKWFASKFLPKRYGDKMTLAGDADGPPIIQLVSFKDVKPDGE